VAGRQQTLGVLGEDGRLMRLGQRRPGLRAGVVAAACLATVAAGCSADDQEPDATGPSPTVSPPPTASEQPLPDQRACYRLTFDQAIAPTTDLPPVDCATEHTSLTFAVGTVDNIVDGHLLAVDSRRVQAAVAATCPRRLAEFTGGSTEALRLSMLRTVWFTPTVEESDTGAEWYRCDAIAVAGDGRLAVLRGRLAGVLSTAEGRDRFGMCGTAAPDAPTFERVICSEPHAWRAIATVDFEPGRYPGERAVRDRGQTPCEDAAAAAADDALDYEWGYEWPTQEQWQAGQTFGRCWTPSE
jgi:hypothetical protein